MSNQQGNVKVKYDSKLLLKYAFDYKTRSEDGEPHIINLCRVKVKKTGGAVLAHYYAQVYLANGFNFEFHPGSQPRTFQPVDPNKRHMLYKSLVLCERCCRKELERFVEGENSFNIALRNCETILCKRNSVQTVIGAALLVVLLINILKFEAMNLIFVAFLVFLLYFVNNHQLTEPYVEYCRHFKIIDKEWTD